MNHVMLDLETMSTRPNAAIVSIGAVPFDSAGKIAAPVSCFYQNVYLSSCQDSGMHIEAETINWWLEQSEPARIALHEMVADIRTALARFSFWWEKTINKATGDVFLWGNGAGFDNVILREAYKINRIICPWHFRHDRDMRTLKMVYQMRGHTLPDKITYLRNKGIEHHALHDAIYQAFAASEMLKAIKIVKRAPK